MYEAIGIGSLKIFVLVGLHGGLTVEYNKLVVKPEVESHGTYHHKKDCKKDGEILLKQMNKENKKHATYECIPMSFVK